MKWNFQNLSPTILALVAVFIVTGCGEEEEIIEEPLNVIWTMPPNGYDGMPETVKIQFNHVIEPSTIDGAIIVSPSLGEIDQERSYWIDGYTYRVVFAESPDPGTKYTVIVAKSVKDVYGNSLPHPYTFSFTYRFGIEDTEPESGEESVPLDEEISIDFSYPIDIEACKDAFSISPAVEGRFSFSRYSQLIGPSSVLYFIPFERLNPSTEYTVTIDKGAKSSSGELLAEPHTFTFTTEGFRVEHTNPSDSERDVPLDEDIGIDFSYSIDIEACKDAFSISPAIKGNFSFSRYSQLREQGTELYFIPFERLNPSTEYTITIGKGAKASNGELLAEAYTFTFTTERFRIESIQPQDGQRNVPPDEDISIGFNYPIDIEACKDNFSISPAVDGKFSLSRYSRSNLYFYFTPFERLNPSTEYTITIGKGAKASSGETLAEPYTFTFTTEEFRVEYTRPTDGETDVRLSIWSVYVTFNSSIDLAACIMAFNLLPPVQGELFLESSNELHFKPSEPLIPFTEYTVTIDTSAKASNGEPLAEPYIFSFTTER